MENIVILYVDDNVDPYISQYLYDQYKVEEVVIKYLEKTFTIADTYESLLEDKDVCSADIIIIDSMLFENAYLSNQKLTGEEFEIILRKVFPFKEVIVVTQKDVDEEYKIVRKYDTSSDDSSETFFENVWKPKLNKAVEKIILCRKTLKRIEEKNYVEPFFFEEIQRSLQGDSRYNNLTVADIDRLIDAFESMKKEHDSE